MLITDRKPVGDFEYDEQVNLIELNFGFPTMTK